mmetsp:Transcript_5431/g.15353  ORF Transcript_5431/g.15353 Transcript_5431/m.15353 type:complete len:170 (+) Transcript_5431:309-818(+)
MCSKERREEAIDSSVAYVTEDFGHVGCSMSCLDVGMVQLTTNAFCDYLNCDADGSLCLEAQKEKQCESIKTVCNKGNKASCFWFTEILLGELLGVGASRMPVDGEFCLPPNQSKIASYCPNLVWKEGSGDWCEMKSSTLDGNGVSRLNNRFPLAAVTAAAAIGGGTWVV